MTDESRPGPKRYRLRAYDNNYEVFDDRNHLVTLDLETAAGLHAALVELEATRIALAAIIQLDEQALRTFRLAVHTWPAGGYVMDWVGRA
jgi:hypothetical protein